MAYRIQQRRDTAARWAEMNPILLDGEMGLVTDNPNQYKIGDGVHTWNELPLRGYTGTIAQTLGNNENAVASQKVVTEKFTEQDKKLSDIGSEVGYFEGTATYEGSGVKKICNVHIMQGQEFSFIISGNLDATRLLLAADYELNTRIMDGILFNKEYTLVADEDYHELYLFVSGGSSVGDALIVVERGQAKRITNLSKEVKSNTEKIINIEKPIKEIDVIDGVYYPTRWFNTIGEFGSIEPSENVDFQIAYINLLEKEFIEEIHIKSYATEVAMSYYFLDRTGILIDINKNLGLVDVVVKASEIPTNAISMNINNYKHGLQKLIVKVKYKKPFHVNYNLYGKRVLMLGDSITEMKKDRKGISEWFSYYSGANVVSGGIGASHLTRRKEATLDVQTEHDARSNTDVIPIIDAFLTNDWSYVDAGAYYEKTVLNDDNDDIIERLKNVNLSDIDIITIFAGTNDSRNSITIGTNTDKNEIKNVHGAINYIVEHIHSAYPNIQIFFFTPIPRWYERGDNGETWSDVYAHPWSGILLPDIASAISAAAKHNHVPCCDLYWGMGWNFYNFGLFLQQDKNVTDGTHPYNGLDCIAKKMVSFISCNVR